ncbi:hypothetical protein [Spirosoma pollinicola]|nr:hypothetical protein [Spirosoma pollinicola]
MNTMTNQPSKKPGSILKTALIGLLILFGIALLVGTLTVMFP